MKTKPRRTKRRSAAAYSRTAGNDSSELREGVDDLDPALKSIEAISSVNTGIWLSYLLALFYFAVAAGAVTHADLLLRNPVKLPFLNIDLPILAFFFLTPLLFLILHAYTLVHFVLLAQRTNRFHQRLLAQFPGDDQQSSTLQDDVRQQLPSNIFVQFLAGPNKIRSSGFGFLLKFIVWATLVFASAALLLLIEVQFLPYHDSSITWTHRFALAADLVILWWLWLGILSSSDDFRGWRTWHAWLKALIAVAVSACVFLFSWTVATLPGEWQEAPMKWFAFLEPTRIIAR